VSTPEVVCIGLATLDTVVRVERVPTGDERMLAHELVVAGGGPAATAAVTLARLGVATAFVGAVGNDDAGDAIRTGLREEGVDVRWLQATAGARSPQSVVLVSGGERAIVAYPGTVAPPALAPDAVEACARASWVHVDHVGYAASPAGVRLSVDGGNRIDGLDLAAVALYAPTDAMLRDQVGSTEAALEQGADVVVVTRGAAGSVAHTRDGEVVEAPGYEVEVVSTLGAGDVFHGALLARLVRDAPLEEALVFANRCAALSCRALDGRSAIPALEEAVA
jgi:sulfofructose kinase